jgi:hypothetical protein
MMNFHPHDISLRLFSTYFMMIEITRKGVLHHRLNEIPSGKELPQFRYHLLQGRFDGRQDALMVQRPFCPCQNMISGRHGAL